MGDAAARREEVPGSAAGPGPVWQPINVEEGGLCHVAGSLRSDLGGSQMRVGRGPPRLAWG